MDLQPLITLASEYPLLAIVAVVTLLLGVTHELQIFLDILTVLARHSRHEVTGLRKAWGRFTYEMKQGDDR